MNYFTSSNIDSSSSEVCYTSPSNLLIKRTSSALPVAELPKKVVSVAKASKKIVKKAKIQKKTLNIKALSAKSAAMECASSIESTHEGTSSSSSILSSNESTATAEHTYDCCNPLVDSLSVQKVDYLALPQLATAQQIEQGMPVSLKAHIKDILKHYDVYQMPGSFLDGLTLPSEGKFFLVTPEDPQAWWSAKLAEMTPLRQ